MAGPAHIKIINDIPEYAHRTPKLSKRKIQTLMKEYEIDDDCINNVNDDFFSGYNTARTIIIEMLKKEYWEDQAKSVIIEMLKKKNESERKDNN